MADYGTIKVNKVTYKNGSDSDTDFNFKTDVVSSSDVALKAAKAGDTFTGDILIDNQKELRLGEPDGAGTNYVGFEAPDTIASNVVWKLPNADGSASQFLKTDGSGNLSWASDTSTDSTKMPLAGGTFTGNVNAGVDDTGVDVKFFGATAGAYLLWDESADSLLTGGGATIDIVKDKLKIGGTAVTTTAAELNQLDNKTAVNTADAQTVTGEKSFDDVKYSRGTINAIGTTGTFTIPLDSGNNHSITLSGGSTLTFSNLDADAVGQSGTVYCTNNGAHSHGFAGHCKFVKGLTIPAVANKDFIVTYFVPTASTVVVDIINLDDT